MTQWECRRCQCYVHLDHHVKIRDISSIICDYAGGLIIERRSVDVDMTFGQAHIELKKFPGECGQTIIISLIDKKTCNRHKFTREMLYFEPYLQHNLFDVEIWRFAVYCGQVLRGNLDVPIGKSMRVRLIAIVRVIHYLILTEETGGHLCTRPRIAP